MYLKGSTLLGIFLMVGLTGCVTPQLDVAWPEPRPLGKDFATYRPPHEPYIAGSTALQLEEPTGDLSLRQALSLALMKNPELAAFSWEVRAKEALTLQAGLLPNPEVVVETENFGGSGAFQRFDASESTIQLSQLIELAGKPSKRRRVAALERDLAGWDYEAKRLDVLTDVTKSFIDVLTAQERLEVIEELVRLAEQVFTTVSERVEAGKVSPIEETKAGITLASTRIELDRAKRMLEASRKSLAATWGSISPAFKKVAGALDAIFPIPPDKQLYRQISKNPDLARWVVEMEQRRAAVKLEEAMRIPNLTISGGVRRLNETNDSAFVLGVSLPIPVFNLNPGGVLKARYRLVKAEEERRAIEVRVRTELAETYQTLSAAYAEVKALKNDVLPGAQSAFEAASERYRQGKFGFLDVLDAQRTLVEARSQYIEALNAYHKAVADVERLIGERLEDIKDIGEQK